MRFPPPRPRPASLPASRRPQSSVRRPASRFRTGAQFDRLPTHGRRPAGQHRDFTGKAYTPRSLNMKTGDVTPYVQPGGPFYGMETSHRHPMVVFAGGLPVERAGQLSARWVSQAARWRTMSRLPRLHWPGGFAERMAVLSGRSRFARMHTLFRVPSVVALGEHAKVIVTQPGRLSILLRRRRSGFSCLLLNLWSRRGERRRQIGRPPGEPTRSY